MIKTLKFWLECSRWYTLPMSFFSWLVIFSYSLTQNGNFLFGILALIGILFAHLATNLFDDFYDFQKLTKVSKEQGFELPNTQKGKCRYLLNEDVQLSDVLKTVFMYSFLAFLVGCFFYFAVGKAIIIYMFGGAAVIFLYTVLSYHMLSEFVVAFAFGPLLYSGVYYVMTGNVSLEPFLLSIPTMIFTVNLLYTDTILDKKIDENEKKKTFVGIFPSDEAIIRFQKILIIMGYLSVGMLMVFDICDWEVIFILLTLPLSIDLVRANRLYLKDSEKLPEKRWYHFPFEDWKDIEENRSKFFMFRMYQARNLMCYSSLILSVVLWF